MYNADNVLLQGDAKEAVAKWQGDLNESKSTARKGGIFDEKRIDKYGKLC